MSFMLESERTEINVRYSYPYMELVIFDKQRNRSFELTAQDENETHEFIENILKNGIDDTTYRVLELIEQIKRPKTQAKNLKQWVAGELKLKDLKKRVKLSNTDRFTDSIRDFNNILMNRFTTVCVEEEWPYRTVKFAKCCDYEIIIAGQFYLEEWDKIDYVVMFNDFGILTLNCCRLYEIYALYKYITKGDIKLLRKYVNRAKNDDDKGLIKMVLKYLCECKRIFDQESYEHIKALLMLYII